MKRSHLALVVTAALLVAGGSPALAKPKPKPATAKPVTTTYWFHSVATGPTGNGNASALAGFAGGDGSGILPMDAVKPTGTQDQDYGTFGAASQPNHACLGNALTMHPTWYAEAAGTFTGSLKVDLFARSTPGKAVVQLFTDVARDLACNEDFPVPAAETTIDLPSTPTFTKVTATLALSKPLVVKGSFAIMVTTEDALQPQASDIGFDSAAAPSGVTWTCVPLTGKKAC